MNAVLEVDEQAHAGYLRLTNSPVKRSIVVGDTGFVVDLDLRGHVVGVEVLDLESGIGVEVSKTKIFGLTLIGSPEPSDPMASYLAFTAKHRSPSSPIFTLTQLRTDWLTQTLRTCRLAGPFVWHAGPPLTRLSDLFRASKYRTAAIFSTVAQQAVSIGVLCALILGLDLPLVTGWILAIGLGIFTGATQTSITFKAVERFADYRLRFDRKRPLR